MENIKTEGAEYFVAKALSDFRFFYEGTGFFRKFEKYDSVFQFKSKKEGPLALKRMVY
ncbi:MAG: hypothetical protein CM15mP58_05170 [Burkholderiaceae bacterium]|nr:MAG: hypothetical protein CM15mP58_05170 [Burkholderiaceae bacterium]